jgi:type II secretory pathway component PulJ
MQRRQGGIALLEAMLAIVILGIGLLGTVGLQARAYSALSDAGARAEATLAAEKLIGIINADVPNIAQYNLAESGTPNSAGGLGERDPQEYSGRHPVGAGAGPGGAEPLYGRYFDPLAAQGQ